MKTKYVVVIEGESGTTTSPAFSHPDFAWSYARGWAYENDGREHHELVNAAVADPPFLGSVTVEETTYTVQERQITP